MIGAPTPPASDARMASVKQSTSSARRQYRTAVGRRISGAG